MTSSSFPKLIHIVSAARSKESSSITTKSRSYEKGGALIFSTGVSQDGRSDVICCVVPSKCHFYPRATSYHQPPENRTWHEGISCMQRIIYEADAMQPPYTSQVVSNSPLVNGLSSPAITLSHSGQALARISSNSDLSFSSRFPVSVSASTFLCPPPIPGIHPAGDVITVTSASGIMRSRRRSPAESILRPIELA